MTRAHTSVTAQLKTVRTGGERWRVVYNQARVKPQDGVRLVSPHLTRMCTCARDLRAWIKFTCRQIRYMDGRRAGSFRTNSTTSYVVNRRAACNAIFQVPSHER